tara:strand:- start:1509 stop:1682 length:174 start_codon:yes stop_codon:yes gene_type:complete
MKDIYTMKLQAKLRDIYRATEYGEEGDDSLAHVYRNTRLRTEQDVAHAQGSEVWSFI